MSEPMSSTDRWPHKLPPPECAKCTRLQAENQRLKEYARLVETATEAQDCNGVRRFTSSGRDCVVITLHSSWFERARALLAGDREVRDE